MRRIFTQSIALVCMLAIAGSSFAQTATCTTTPISACTGSVIESFNTNDGGFAKNGFTYSAGSNALQSSNLVENASYTLLSPQYYFLGNVNLIVAGFDFSGSGVNEVSFAINIKKVSDNTVIGTCGGTVTASGTICRSIPISTQPAGTFIQYEFIFTADNFINGAKVISFDNFAVSSGAQAPLPVRFSGLNAKVLSNGNVSLVWNVDAEENLKGYEVERSADGVRFASIGTVAAAGQHSYSFVDAAALATAYYRIRSVDVDGKAGYSTIASVKGGQSSIVVKGFMSSPNTLIVQHDAALKGSSIVVSSGDGRIVRSVLPQVGAQQTSIDLSVAGKGLYIVRYEAANGEVSTVKFIKQ